MSERICGEHFQMFADAVFLRPFWGRKRAREVFKKLPGCHSFVLTEHEPVASHGHPVSDHSYRFGSLFVRPNHNLGTKYTIFSTKYQILGAK